MNSPLLSIIVSTIVSLGQPTVQNKVCSLPTVEVVSPQQDIFNDYISTLNHISLPLHHTPEGNLPSVSPDYDAVLFKFFKHAWTVKPLGILYQNEQSIGIIDCSEGEEGFVPFLTTYDLEGNKIDSLSFYNKTGTDIGYEAIEHFTVYENKTITIVDTVKRWKLLPDQSDRIDNSLTTTTSTANYIIKTSGIIELQPESDAIGFSN